MILICSLKDYKWDHDEVMFLDQFEVRGSDRFAFRFRLLSLFVFEHVSNGSRLWLTIYEKQQNNITPLVRRRTLLLKYTNIKEVFSS